MSLIVPSSKLNLTSSLEHLSLRSCNLQRNFPSQVFQLTKFVPEGECQSFAPKSWRQQQWPVRAHIQCDSAPLLGGGQGIFPRQIRGH
ncbi:hypothetical protein SLA2020_100040 [Shorea laevis]